MTTDLFMLTIMAVMTALLFVPYGLGGAATLGLGALAGNRDEIKGDLPGWIGRAQRTHRNTLEALTPFAALVLVAHVSGQANATTALAAQVFVAARVVYVPVYIIGIPWVRTIVWTVGLGALLVMAWEIVT